MHRHRELLSRHTTRGTRVHEHSNEAHPIRGQTEVQLRPTGDGRLCIYANRENHLWTQASGHTLAEQISRAPSQARIHTMPIHTVSIHPQH